MFNKENLTRLLVVVVCCAPMFAMADAWDQTLVTNGRAVRIGMYAVAGCIALGTLIWSGVRWMVARSTGDHSTTFVDYLQQAGVILVVGGSVAFAAAMWQIFGTGNPT